MSTTMTNRGYAARIECDDDDRIFRGRIAGIPDGVGFRADSVDSLRQAFREAVEDYLETCAKIEKERRSLLRTRDVPCQPGNAPQGCPGG